MQRTIQLKNKQTQLSSHAHSYPLTSGQSESANSAKLGKVLIEVTFRKYSWQVAHKDHSRSKTFFFLLLLRTKTTNKQLKNTNSYCTKMCVCVSESKYLPEWGLTIEHWLHGINYVEQAGL